MGRMGEGPAWGLRCGARREAGPGAAPRHCPPTGDGELKPFPTSHRRAQTDRQTCACQDSHHLPIPSHTRRRWETLGGACLFLDRSARLEAGPWGQDGLARKGCPRMECDRRSLTFQAVVHLGSHLRRTCSLPPTSPPPGPTSGLLPWEPPPTPYLPASLLWHSGCGCGHLPASLS